MSETEAPVCPIPLTDFPPAVAKSLDAKAPVPVRIMAAKGLLACPPKDLLQALFVLTFDPDPKVADTARASASGAQEKILAGLRDEDMNPATLAFYTQALRNNPRALEMIALNPTTPDDAFVELSSIAPDTLVEIIAQNQLRILRDARIPRAIVQNPNTRIATKDTLLDFCVRSGLVLEDLPEYAVARRRILGADPVAAAAIVEAEKNTAAKVVEELGDGITDETQALEETKRLTFTQRVMKMSVAEKIKLATLGNKEARTMLLRDSNKLVALAAIQSPRITDGEILSCTHSRTLHEDVMRYIVGNREWLKSYQVKVNLVNNPKVQVPVALKLILFLHPNELKAVTRNKNIAQVIVNQARGLLQTKERK